MNYTCTPQKLDGRRIAGTFIQRLILFCFLFVPGLSLAQFDLNFECEENRSIDVQMKGAVDSSQVTMMVSGDTSAIDSILVEIAIKGQPADWGTCTVTTSAGEVIVIPYPGLITNTGSNENAALYRTWVAPAQFITATTPALDPSDYDDWQSMTLFKVQNNVDCVNGATSGGDILIFHFCDSLYFEVDSVGSPTKQVQADIPLSEIGDADTTRIAIISINYVHQGVVTNVSVDTFDGNDNNSGSNALLLERIFDIPGDVDSIMIIAISPDGVFPPFTSCTQFPPFGGDSFIIGTIVVTSDCDECCTVEAECDFPDQLYCSFDSIPAMPEEFTDSVALYSGDQNLDSLAFLALGGTYTTSFCDTVYIVGVDSVMGGGCGIDTGFVTRYYIFVHNVSGNPVDTCIQRFIVVDDTPPSIACPADVDLECTDPTDPANTGVATATDDCSEPAISFTDVVTPGECAFQYTITRTWTAEDDCGNLSTCTQIISVDDTTPPSITCPDDVALECTDPTDPGSTGFPIVLDNCTTAPLITYMDNVTPGECVYQYTITRTWSAEDACGNVATCVQLISVDDTTPPVLSAPADTTVSCDQLIALDGYIDELLYVNSPGNISGFYETGGAAFGPPVTDMPITADVVLVDDGVAPTTDGCEPILNDVTGKIALIDRGTCPFVSKVLNAQNAGAVGVIVANNNDGSVFTMGGTDPTITIPSVFVTMNTGDILKAELMNGPVNATLALVLEGMATDNCDPDPQVTFADEQVAGDCPQNYTILRTWTAIDACGNTATSVQTITVIDTTAPIIIPPTDLTVECIEDVAFGDPFVADNCSEFDVTFSDMSGAAFYGTLEGGQEVPPNMSPATGSVIGSYDEATGMLFIEVGFSGLTGTTTASHIHGPALIGQNAGVQVPLPIPFGVTFGNFSLNTTLSMAQGADLVAGLYYVNIHTTAFPGGEIRAQLAVSACDVLIKRTWTATDECGNEASAFSTILVDDTIAPSITCPMDLTLECPADTDPANTGFAIATDNCDDDVFVTYQDVIIPGECPQEYTINRTWIAEDDCQNRDVCVQSILVVDTTPPVISCPADVTVECDELLPVGGATAVDACDQGPLVITFSDVVTPGECVHEYSIVRTFLVADACGNSASCTQRIEVVDTTPPSITCPDDAIIECTESTSPDNTGTPIVVDNCDTAPLITYSDETTPGECPQEYMVTRTWMATDACDNVATCVQIINVVDTTPPVISCPADVTIECDEPLPTLVATATDNCDEGPLVVTYSDETIPGECESEYTIIRTFVTADACGNPASCTQVINVVDTTPPALTCPPDGEFSCEDGAPFFDNLDDFLAAGGNAFDNCGLDSASFTLESSSVTGECPLFYTFLYSITDLCGNLNSCVHQVTVTDDTPPNITCPADLVFQCIDEVPPVLTSIEEFIGAGGNIFDNCALDSLSFDVTSVSDGATCPETITRTYQIADFCGNVSTCVQTIVVDDTTPPMVTCPPDMTIECTEPEPPFDFTYSDNCDPDPLVQLISSISQGDCPNEFIISRSVTVIDACGNSASCGQTITIIDSTPPVITCPADATVECSSEFDPSDPENVGFANATDNCSQEVLITFVDDVAPGECAQEFVVTRTWFAEDECGNVSSCIQTISVEDNEAPQFTALPEDITIECGDDIPDGMADAVDNCGEVTVTYVDLICDVQTEGFTGDYDFANWTATEPNGGFVTTDGDSAVTISGPDGVSCNGESTLFSITIPADGKLVFGWEYQSSDEDGPSYDPFGYNINGTFVQLTDDDGDVDQEGIAAAIVMAGDVFAFEQNSTDCGFGEAATTVIDFFTYTCEEDGIPEDVCDYTIFRCWNATDECGNTAYALQQIRVIDTTAPSITCPDDVTIDCDESTDPANTGSATAIDACDENPVVTFDDSIEPGECPQEMTITRTWFAEDACGLIASCVQTIEVVDTEGPVVVCPPNITVECIEDVPACPANLAAFIALGGSVTDNCDPNVSIECDAIILFDDCEGTGTFDFLFTDACGNTATCTWIVTIEDTTPPEIDCPADITLLEGDSSDPANTGTATGTDNCDPDVDIDFEDVEIEGECPEQITIERTWTATDECGNTASCLQIIYYDVECICELTCPDDITINLDPGACNAIVDFNPPTFEGACPEDITMTATLTQNTNTTLIEDALQCGVNPTSHWRAYDLAAMGVVGDFQMNSLGMASWSAGTVQVFVYAYTGVLPNNTLDLGQMTLLGQANPMAVGGFSLTTHTLTAPVVIPAGSKFVVEQRQTAGGPWCIASNYQGNTQPAYMNCNGSPFGFPAIPTSYVDLGFGFIHPIQVLNGGTFQQGGILEQYSGLPSGSEFPIGVTENCFRLIDANTGEVVDSCCFIVEVNEYPFEIQPVCNDLVQISLDQNCEARVCADVILEGGPYGCYDDWLVYVDQYGFGNDVNCVSLSYNYGLHTVTVVNPETGNSCWGEILIEDKLPPQLTCMDFTLTCGQDLTPIFTPPIMGVNTCATILSPGLPIGPNAGVITTSTCNVSLPQGVEIVDVNVCVKITHTWIGDCNTDIIHPSGAVTNLWGFGQCNLTDNMHQKFDDDGPLTVLCADINDGCDFILQPVAQQLGTPSLDQYIGENPNGIWTLMVTDNANGDGGTLDEWYLEIEYAQNAPFAPTVSDNCDENVDLVYVDVETGEICDSIIIERTWTATDDSGNTAQCVQTLTIEPLTLDALQCPETYEGSCGGSSDPDVTGWPTIDGVPLVEGGICNVFVGYWDQEIPDCGNGVKIVRRWTILDWCTQEVEECVQLIKLADMDGPVLTCPADQTVGSDPWFCNKDVNLQIPQAYDVCGTAFEIVPSVSAGTLIHFSGNNYRVDDLPVGTHTVTWTATDACGNESSCTYTITVEDDVPPVPICDEHTILTLTNDDGLNEGLTKVYATTFDDGSYDNCGPVTFLARRMDSCIDFDWIGPNGEYPNNDGGLPESIDRGLTFQPWVPFACCDVGTSVMVELRVTDLYGNINSCMVEVAVQDKLPPFIACPPDITVSCEFWFDAHETNGFEEADGLEGVFGRVLDAYEYDESDRAYVIIDDPGNNELSQPYHWGLDGWADDNCDVNIDIRTRLFDDCSGDDLPSGAPDHAVRLVERTFRAQDGQGNTSTCRQRIWVVDFDPFYITDTQCGLNNADDVRWPCDLTLTDCPQGELTPENLSGYAPNNRPQVNDDNCSIIGMTYDDQIFYFVDNACYKIVRTWTVIDWCQFDPVDHTGYWTYVQVIKVYDNDGPEFLPECPEELTLCVSDPRVTLPSNNQVFLGEDNPNSSSCSVHVNLTHTVMDACSDKVFYDVKVYPFNGSEYIQVVATTEVALDSQGIGELVMNTASSSLPSNHPVTLYGLPYNDRYCSNWPLPGGEKDYHRVLWSVEDGCGNLSTCEYLLRLEDCKQPTPVCVGLSSVVMPSSGCVTIWAKDFDSGSSVDDCTAHDDLLFSFSGDVYEPSRDYCCVDIEANGSPSFLVEIWVADEGNDQNCNGFVNPLGIEWSERNKDFCTTFIVIDDNEGVCGDSLTGGLVETEESDPVEKVHVSLRDINGQVVSSFLTDGDGVYHFINPLFDFTIEPKRNDNHKNGVSTLDLVAVQKHLLGLQPITSPYKLIAADANNSESVSALDLVEIRKLILGLYTEFPNNQSWRFVDASFEFDDPTHPWPFDETIDSHSGMGMAEDFMAVKVGDINGTVVANATQIVTRGARNVLKLQSDVQYVNSGDLIEIPVTADNYQQMIGFQFTMELTGLEYASLIPGALAVIPEYVGEHKGAITMSWADVHPVDVPKDEVLFTLQFVAKKAGDLNELISISSAITEAEAYVLSGSETVYMDITLVFGQTTASTDVEFALYQNQPNPFAEQTVIGFDLPEAMSATLTVYDLSGRAVEVINGDYQAGYHEIILKRKDLLSTGAYYYRLDAGDFTATKKMILTDD